MGIYVGFDPGGIGGFGWAVVSGEKFPLRLIGCGIADHAQGAFNAAMDCAGSKVNAVGIDAPLFWSEAGDRSADRIVRKAITRLGAYGATVIPVNALRGACLIQGILVAMPYRRRLTDRALITESHPKALLWLLGKATPERHPRDLTLNDLNEYVVENGVQGASDHERDAALGAVGAFAAESRLPGWQNLYVLEPNPITPLDPPPGYWMPLNPEPGNPVGN